MYSRGFICSEARGHWQNLVQVTWMFKILVLMPPSCTLGIIYFTSIKQWNSGAHLQFVSSWLWLTFSGVMSDSLFGVFCPSSFVNTAMHHDWRQPRFLSLPGCHTQVPRVQLWFSVGCCGRPGHGRLPYMSGMSFHVISDHCFGCICWKVWKFAKCLFLYCTILLAIWQHSSYLPDSGR